MPAPKAQFFVVPNPFGEGYKVRARVSNSVRMQYTGQTFRTIGDQNNKVWPDYDSAMAEANRLNGMKKP